MGGHDLPDMNTAGGLLGGCLAPGRRLVVASALTQLLSLALAVTGISSSLLVEHGVNVPTVQATCAYLMLVAVFVPLHVMLPALLSVCAVDQGSLQVADEDAALIGGPVAGSPPAALTHHQMQQIEQHNEQHNEQQQEQQHAHLPPHHHHSHKARLQPTVPPDWGQPGCMTLWWWWRRLDAAGAANAASAKLQRLRRALPMLAALTFLDVEANVLITRAYAWTSLTSVTLLDSATIPCVMLMSWALLRCRYRAGHICGAACCVAGLAMLVLSDSSGGSGSGAGPRPLLGDALALAGAVLYAASNVCQEALVLSGLHPGELLAGLGVGGAALAAAQAAAAGEWAALQAAVLARTTTGSGGSAGATTAALALVGIPLAGFAAAMLCFYSLAPWTLALGGAALLNLGLLTSDAWAAGARAAWLGGFPRASVTAFAASLGVVACGICLYAAAGSPRPADACQTLRCELSGSGSGSSGDGGAHLLHAHRHWRLSSISSSRGGNHHSAASRSLAEIEAGELRSPR